MPSLRKGVPARNRKPDKASRTGRRAANGHLVAHRGPLPPGRGTLDRLHDGRPLKWRGARPNPLRVRYADRICRSVEISVHSRVISTRRPDVEQYATALGLTSDEPDPLDILARSGGERATDTIQAHHLRADPDNEKNPVASRRWCVASYRNHAYDY